VAQGPQFQASAASKSANPSGNRLDLDDFGKWRE
jgi:hypothetical protein